MRCVLVHASLLKQRVLFSAVETMKTGIGRNFTASIAKLSETDIKPLLCNMCGEALSDLESLIIHTGKHDKKQFFLCAECKEIFTSEGHNHNVSQYTEL